MNTYVHSLPSKFSLFIVVCIYFLFLPSFHAQFIPDTNFIDSVAILANNLIKKNKTKEDRIRAKQCLDSLVFYSKAFGFKERLGVAYNLKGRYYDFLGNNGKALFYYDSALFYLRPCNSIAIGWVTNSLSRVYRDLGMLDSAILMYDETIEIRKKDPQTKESIYGINKLICDKSRAYSLQGNYDLAVKALQESLDFSKKNNCKPCIIDAYIYSSMFYSYINDCSNSKKYALLALEDTGLFIGLQRVYAWMISGDAFYYCDKNSSEAKIYYEESFLKSKSHYHIPAFTRSKLNLARIYIGENKLKQAELMLSDVETSWDKEDITEVRGELLELWGDLSFKKGNIIASKSNYLEAEKIYKANKYNDQLLELYVKLSKIFEYEGEFEESLKYFKLMNQYKDSIISKDKLEIIRELEVKYDLKENESKVRILEQESKLNSAERENSRKNRMILILVFISLFIGSLGVFFYFRNKQKSVFHRERVSLINQKLEKEKRIIETEQRLLLAQLNPHFIYNALSSIDSYILNNQSFEASEYLAHFSKLMRAVLENSRKQFIPLKDEIDMLRTYLVLEQARFNNKFEFNIDIDKGVNLSKTIPCMFIQPFVENAISHGFTPLEKNGRVNISFLLKDNDLLEVLIIDNGVGRFGSSKVKDNHQSVSLQIIMDRISFFKDKFEKDIYFELSDGDQGRGTKVTLIIPFYNKKLDLE